MVRATAAMVAADRLAAADDRAARLALRRLSANLHAAATISAANR